jgi:hypothetical protein
VVEKHLVYYVQPVAEAEDGVIMPTVAEVVVLEV